MNRENIQKAIAIMKRAKHLDMRSYQNGGKTATTEEELHACGKTACFAGYIAISQEFQVDGGKVHIDYGYPILHGKEQEDAIAEWLGIPKDIAERLVFGGTNGSYSMFYKKFWDSVTAQDVIEKLEELLKEI